MITELDLVVLGESLLDQGLKAGDVGTVVFVHQKGKAFEVEFINSNGETVAVATLDASLVRGARKEEIAHTR